MFSNYLLVLIFAVLQPKPEADGKYPVERAKAISGEKLLRNIMSDNKIELYATYVSLWFSTS
jgi:hypothetical protein